MGQDDLFKTFMFTMFNDAELKQLMAIPQKDFNSLPAFINKYCVSGLLSSTLVDSDIPVRIVVGWLSTSETKNPYVAIRRLNFDIYVQKNYEHNVTHNMLERRQDKIQKRLKRLFHDKVISDFKVRAYDLGDLTSNNLDYVRSYISFTMKYIF